MKPKSWYDALSEQVTLEYRGTTYICRNRVWRDHNGRQVDTLLASRLSAALLAQHDSKAQNRNSEDARPASRDPEPASCGILELHLRALEEALIRLKQAVWGRWRLKSWLTTVSRGDLLQFFAEEAPFERQSFPSLDLANLPEPLAAYLKRLQRWVEDLRSDWFFQADGPDTDVALLELGVLMVACERYGDWHFRTDIRPLDFSALYLRTALENRVKSGKASHPLRVRALASIWKREEGTCCENIPEYSALQTAAELGLRLVSEPNTAPWLTFVQELPAPPTGPEIIQLLSDLVPMATSLCEIWDDLNKERGLVDCSPPGDIVQKAIACVAGNSSPQQFYHYLRTAVPWKRRNLKLSWQVLPRGWWRAVAGGENRSNSKQRVASPQLSPARLDRFEFLDTLNPIATYSGAEGKFRCYSVFEYARHVVADCEVEGNAIYLVDKRLHAWKTILSRSKREALRAGATRIFHDAAGKWKRKLCSLIDAELADEQQEGHRSVQPPSISNVSARVPPAPKTHGDQPLLGYEDSMSGEAREARGAALLELMALLELINKQDRALSDKELLILLAPLFEQAHPVIDLLDSLRVSFVRLKEVRKAIELKIYSRYYPQPP